MCFPQSSHGQTKIRSKHDLHYPHSVQHNTLRLTAPDNSLFTLRSSKLQPRPTASLTQKSPAKQNSPYLAHNSDHRRPLSNSTVTVHRLRPWVLQQFRGWALSQFFVLISSKLVVDQSHSDLVVRHFYLRMCMPDLGILSKFSDVLIDVLLFFCVLFCVWAGVWPVHWIHQAMQGLSRCADCRTYLGSGFSCGC